MSAPNCRVPHCRQAARVVVRDPTGDDIEVCMEHLQDMLRCSSDVIHVVRLGRG